MTRKIAVAVGTLAIFVLLAGCVSGLGGGDGGDSAAAAAGVIIQTEMVPGHEGFPEDTSALVKPCVPLGTYGTGMQPAWHVYVIDPSTGEKMTNQTVDNVVVETDRGMTVPTEFHTDDNGWHGCYVIPEDAETGEVGYTVTVEVGDESYQSTGSFEVVPRDEV